MPEGPEVKNIASIFQQYINHRLTDILISVNSKFYNFLEGEDLIIHDSILENVIVKGKKMFLMFTDNDATQLFTIVVSFGMEGKWLLEPKNHSDFSIILSKNGSNVEFFYDDSRHFGNIKIVKNIDNIIKTLGPDILNDHYENRPGDYEKIWIDCIKKRRRRIIGDVIVDQSVVSGIGNYLRSEILFMANIDWRRSVDTLMDEEMHRIFIASKKIMTTAYEMGGMTIRSYRNPHGKNGNYIPLIYGRKTTEDGRPIIKSFDRKKRSIYYVD